MSAAPESATSVEPGLHALRAGLLGYRDRHRDEASDVDLFMQFLDRAPVPAIRADGAAPTVFDREHAVGHFTGSAWLVSADGARVLLTHHRKLGRWLQLGGHADGDADLAQVALREAQEESGLKDLFVDPAIFDIDRHAIPPRGDEPGHLHYDVRYIVRAGGAETFVVSEESHALAWREVAALAQDVDADASLRRMAGKWLAGR